jgi:tetratricopeptide (TPR) repeat protein
MRALKPLRSLRGRDASAARARLMVIQSGTRYFQNRRAESIRWARSAEREARQADAKDALADAYKLLDLALKESGQIDKAIYSEQALKLYEELDDLRSQGIVLNNLGIIAQERSRWDDALALYRRFLEITELTGNRQNASLAKYNIAEILSDQGRLDEAETLLREVIRVWRASGADADVAEARRELGKLFARRGEFEVARELLDAAHEEQVRDDRPGEALATAVRICELEVLAGTPVALAKIETAVRTATRTEGGTLLLPMLRRLEGYALIQAGAIEAGEDRFAQALDAATSRGDVFETALLLDGLIRLRTLRGETTDELVAERQDRIAQLGIIRMPSFPLQPERLLEPIP